MNLIVGAFKDRFFLSRHRPDHLHSFAQAAHALRSSRIIVAIATVFVLVPARPKAEIEPTRRKHSDGAGHLCEQGRVPIPRTGDQLTDTYPLGITCQRRGSCPALERRFLRWAWNGMEVID